MTRQEIVESAKACMEHKGYCNKCEWDNRACWGGMSKTEAAAWMIGEHRLTPEERRYIELGMAVEYAAKKHEPAPIVIVSIEGFMGWYRKEVEK